MDMGVVMLEANMQELVGYRHEETREEPSSPARKKADLTAVSEIRKVQIMNLVFDTVAENGGYDWIHDQVDIDTVGVLLDEQHDAENEWLAKNWDSILEQVYQKIERDHQHERNQRDESVPRWGR